MRKVIWILQIVFNLFFSYWSVIIMNLSIAFMKNQPKGYGYYVPEREAFLNFTLGVFLLLMYLTILVSGNLVCYKTGKVTIIKYYGIVIVEFLVGISFFFIAIGDKRLF